MSLAILTKSVIALSALETAAHGFTHVVVLRHEDLTNTSASGTPTQTLELLNLAEGDLVQECAVRLKEKFQDTADAAQNSTTIEVGDGGDVDRFLASQELNVNGTEIVAKAGTGTQRAYTSADTLDVVVTGTASKALSDLNAGEAHIYLRIARLDALSDTVSPELA
jgi:hypothetical protein